MEENSEGKPEAKEAPPEKTLGQSIWELVRFAALALVIVIPIRVFLAEPFVVSGSSMYPTFSNGDYLIVDKISYRVGDPKRDDVVIFRYPNDPSKFFIKRIIGLPEETVDIKESTITITNDSHKDGFTLTEPYVKNAAKNILHRKLEKDEYFVMGDNRIASSDSRYWGPVKRSLLVGRAFLRLLPMKKINILPGNYEQKDSD